MRTGGVFLNIPFINLDTSVCEPRVPLFTGATMADTALLAVFKVEYLNPLSYRVTKKSKNFPTGGLYGSICCLQQKADHTSM